MDSPQALCESKINEGQFLIRLSSILFFLQV